MNEGKRISGIFSRQARELWEAGRSDDNIARNLGFHVDAVKRWRQQNGLSANPGRALGKSEIRLPAVGQKGFWVPHFMENENVVVQPEEAVVIHVNQSKAAYTVEYSNLPGRPRETFKGY